MHRTGLAILMSLALMGCGGSSGGGSGGSGDVLFAGPLMFVGAQMRIYGEINLQLADFNGDEFPELLYEVVDQRTRQTVFMPGSESELFEPEQFPNVGVYPVVADFDADGNLDIFSKPPLDNRRGSLASDWQFVRGNGDNTFVEPVPLNLSIVAGEGLLGDIAVGDINADGFEDILAQGFPDVITPLINQGDATFSAAQQISVLESFSVLASEDLNRDRFDDIVRFRFDKFDETVEIHLSLGDGTFAPAQIMNTAGTRFTPPLVDLNNDGNHDILGYSEPGIAVALGAGDGTFAQPILTETMYGLSDAQTLTVADFNDDGNLDLVFVLEDSGDSLYIALGNGDGTFGPNVILIADADPSARVSFGTGAVLDVDRDGNLDLLVTVRESPLSLFFFTSRFLRPYFGNGDGTFREENSARIEVDSNASMITEIVRPRKPTTRPLDVDDDGNLDLLVHNIGVSGDLSLFPGNGDGTFVPERRVPLGEVRIRQTSDLDNDGLIDFFGSTMTRFFGILRNYGGGSLQPLPLIPVTLTSTPGFGFEGTFNLDQDGLPDPLFWFSDGTIRVLYNLGEMQFEPLTTVANIGEEVLRGITDITGDGYPDIVSDLNWNEPVSQFFVRAGGPSGTFGPAVMSEIPRVTGNGVVFRDYLYYDTADFNGDGNADIVLVREQIEGGERTVVSLLYGQSDGTLMHAQDVFVPWIGTVTRIVDLDLDGDPDFVVGATKLEDRSNTQEPLRLFLSPLLTNNSGLFELGPGVLALKGHPLSGYGFDVTDITGDDIPDAVVYSDTIGLMIAVGQGDGSFDQLHYFRAKSVREPAIGDFDGDGDGDFAAIIADGGMIELIENRLVND